MLPNRADFAAWLMRMFIVFAAACSISVTAFAFPVEVRRADVHFAVFSVHREHVSARVSLTNRVLARLAEAETREIDPWLRDDYRIAWITVLKAARGESAPQFWATYQVLGTSPDQVWPSIVAKRKAFFGRAYAEFFGAEQAQAAVSEGKILPPKKPLQSFAAGGAKERVRAEEPGQRAKAAAA